MTDSKNQEAIMYMPAEPKLLEYAYRVKQDVPFEADVVKFEKMKPVLQDVIEARELSTVTFNKQRKVTPQLEVNFDRFDDVIEHPVLDGSNEVKNKHFLTSAYERVVNISGRFQQEAIALGLSELR